MSFWGGLVGGVVGGVGGFFAGGPVGAAVGAGAGYAAGDELSDGGESHASVNYPSPYDYSTAMMYSSDANKSVALAQIQGQGFAMQQAGLDREMHFAAQVELGIEKLDTKLQVSLLEYRQQMAAEENRHVERIAQAGKDLQQIQSTYSLGADLPPPEEA